jgi:ankyrin repeat protein
VRTNTKNTANIKLYFVPQHLDIAALLIKYKADVNATDRWHFTPLHEAAQKGRTQLCALLVREQFSPFFRPDNFVLPPKSLYIFPQVYVENVLIC